MMRNDWIAGAIGVACALAGGLLLTWPERARCEDCEPRLCFNESTCRAPCVCVGLDPGDLLEGGARKITPGTCTFFGPERPPVPEPRPEDPADPNRRT